MFAQLTDDLLQLDLHAPDRVRVLATLRNVPQFATAFNCTPQAHMRATNTCLLW